MIACNTFRKNDYRQCRSIIAVSLQGGGNISHKVEVVGGRGALSFFVPHHYLLITSSHSGLSAHAGLSSDCIALNSASVRFNQALYRRVCWSSWPCGTSLSMSQTSERCGLASSIRPCSKTERCTITKAATAAVTFVSYLYWIFMYIPILSYLSD